MQHHRRLEVEHRFLLAPGEVRAFLGRALRNQLTADVHDPARPVTFVRTTYFDSDDLDFFHSQPRVRVRLREYAGAPVPDGIPTLTGACAFELKEATDRARRKSRIVGTRAVLAELLCRDDDRDGDPSLAIAAAAVRTGAIRPRLTTFFRRRSFSGDGIRITLDDRLTFARPVPPGRAGEPAEPADVIGRGPSLILEVKLSEAPPAWLSGALDDFLVMTRFSKFRDGMLAIDRADSVQAMTAAPRVSIAPSFRELSRAHWPSPV